MPGAREDAYAGQVAALLVTSVTMGGGRGAEAAVTPVLERVRMVVAAGVEVAAGAAHAIADDTVVAGFHDLPAALDVALRVLADVRERVDEPSLAMRMGIHGGNVWLTEEGAAFEEAVAVAAGLAALARPGTIAVSDAVARAMGASSRVTVEDIGRCEVVGGAPAVHVFLLIPHVTLAPAASWPRRAVLAGLAGAALAGSAVVLLQRERQPESVLTVGVMPFRPPPGRPAQAWLAAAVRDALNTQLSSLSAVKVYSREFLDFLVTRQGLTEYEAATRLGIRKLLSGDVAVVGRTLRVETQIVDVASGVLESSYTTAGTEEALLDLQNQLVMGAIARLHIRLAPEDERRLATHRTTDLEALRNLLEADGAGASPGEPVPAAPSPGSWLSWPRAAFAEDDRSRREILDLLERYRRATESEDVDALARLYTEFSAEQRTAVGRYFRDAENLRVAVESVDAEVAGDEAVVSFTRTDDFTDARTGRPLHVPVRLTKMLRRTEDRWRFVAGR